MKKTFFLIIVTLFDLSCFAQRQIKTFEFSVKDLLDSGNNKAAVIDSFSTYNDSVFYIKIINPNNDSIMPINYVDQTGTTNTLYDLSKKISLFGREYITVNISVCINKKSVYRDSIVCKVVKNKKTLIAGITRKRAVEYVDSAKMATEDILLDTIHVPLVICENTKNIQLTFYRQVDTFKNSSFVAFSLIKTIAGSVPQDELLDIFMKINYGRNNRFFSLVGADAGIVSSKDTAQHVFKLNEAIANFNVAFYLKNFDQKLLKRTGFFGGGLKVFNSQAYVGAHLGSIEINSRLLGSYLLFGYYYSPFIHGVKIYEPASASQFRHNVYVEAALNAFGDNVPTLVKAIRFKFGLLLPIAASGPGQTGDTISPFSKDISYRLAIEAPLGGLLKF